MPIVARDRVVKEALRLHDMGLWIVVMSMGKRCRSWRWPWDRIPRENLAYLLTTYPDLNIGVVWSQSPLIDVECDTDIAEAFFSGWCGCVVPVTPTYKSRRGLHRLFLRPEGAPDTAKAMIDGVEFRGCSTTKGAYSVVPLSLHPSGVRYRWLPGLSIHEIAPAPLPEHIAERLRAWRSAKRHRGGRAPRGDRGGIVDFQPVSTLQLVCLRLMGPPSWDSLDGDATWRRCLFCGNREEKFHTLAILEGAKKHWWRCHACGRYGDWGDILKHFFPNEDFSNRLIRKRQYEEEWVATYPPTRPLELTL